MRKDLSLLYNKYLLYSVELSNSPIGTSFINIIIREHYAVDSKIQKLINSERENFEELQGVKLTIVSCIHNIPSEIMETKVNNCITGNRNLYTIESYSMHTSFGRLPYLELNINSFLNK